MLGGILPLKSVDQITNFMFHSNIIRMSVVQTDIAEQCGNFFV